MKGGDLTAQPSKCSQSNNTTWKNFDMTDTPILALWHAASFLKADILQRPQTGSSHFWLCICAEYKHLAKGYGLNEILVVREVLKHRQCWGNIRNMLIVTATLKDATVMSFYSETANTYQFYSISSTLPFSQPFFSNGIEMSAKYFQNVTL